MKLDEFMVTNWEKKLAYFVLLITSWIFLSYFILKTNEAISTDDFSLIILIGIIGTIFLDIIALFKEKIILGNKIDDMTKGEVIFWLPKIIDILKTITMLLAVVFALLWGLLPKSSYSFLKLQTLIILAFYFHILVVVFFSFYLPLLQTKKWFRNNPNLK